MEATIEKKPRAAKTARNPESITKGALLLPLQDKVNLVTALKASIEKDLKDREDQFNAAKTIVNGL